MTIFIDTSALFAVLDRDDLNHNKANEKWIRLIENDDVLITTNYILIESFALIQNRLGLKALRVFQTDILPSLLIEWIDERMHLAGVASLFQASRKSLSLVDCISFIFMRDMNISKVFTFDKHFKQEGFKCLGLGD